MGRFLSTNWRPAPGRAINPQRTPVTQTVAVVTPEAPRVEPTAPRFADPIDTSPLRKLALFSGLALLFIEMGIVPEVVAYFTGTNTYLLYFFAPLAYLGVVLTGGIRRTFRSRAAFFFLAFFLWMVGATYFSSWRGGSFDRLKDYTRIELPLLFVIAGLAVNWKEIRLIFYTMVGAGLFNLLTAQFLLQSDNGRFRLEGVGTIGNSNDLASHLLLVLPFLVFVTRDSRKNPMIRFLMFPLIAWGLYVILATASRGALLGILGAILFYLWRSNMRQRTALIVVSVALAGIALVVLPRITLNRYSTMSGSQGAVEEAEESSASRRYLFMQSLIYTAQRPVFGVGPDQFSNFEGKTSIAAGRYGSWHATHCSWTQVSSECGIPGLIFFVGGIAVALLLVNRTYSAARAQGDRDIENACFCYLLAMAGFLVSITFLSNAYRLYFPIMIGLGISMSFAAARQMAARRAAVRPLVRQPV